MENLFKMDDLGVPLFLETPIYWIYVPGPQDVIASSPQGWHETFLGHRESQPNPLLATGIVVLKYKAIGMDKRSNFQRIQNGKNKIESWFDNILNFDLAIFDTNSN